MSDPKSMVQTRLATYGTLSPGRMNHHQMAGMEGRWREGIVNGRLTETGWGSAFGFPGLVLDPAGPQVPVQIFESMDLPQHWARLDAFEGTGYNRILTQVSTPEGELDACIYVLAR